MKYEPHALPLGSPERAKAQLEKLDLLKALRTCRQGQIPLESIKAELAHCLDRLYEQNSNGVILSGYYEAGAFGQYTVAELLRRMFDARDHGSFLKQAYRFEAHSQFAKEIKESISWHFARGLADAEAWRRKFLKLREQDQLSKVGSHEGSLSFEIADESHIENGAPPTVYQLRPMKTIAEKKSAVIHPEPANDPYVVSQTARIKMEKANATHRGTLDILRSFLEARRIVVSESKLIDAYAIIGGRPAIFEVKSINAENEREQIRHAISQLYEYRYLHALPDASVWVVFSQGPSSRWHVDYLTNDRQIHVLWLQNGLIEGPAVAHLERACSEVDGTRGAS